MGVEAVEAAICVSNLVRYSKHLSLRLMCPCKLCVQERQDVLALRNKAVPVASNLEGNVPTVAVMFGPLYPPFGEHRQ